jgi:hypothetical protein
VWIFIFWIALTGCVAAAADARGRSGAAWFAVALFFSPLIGMILLLLFPNVKQEKLLREALAQRSDTSWRAPPPLPKAAFLGKADRVTIDRSLKPFEPDGVFAGVPYRVAHDGSIEAIMQGAQVRFRDFDKFTSALGQA